MLKLYPLFSGSSGNMYLIKSPNANILVDIGVSFKMLNKALENIGLNITDINALLITHEHLDHVKGLSTFLNKTEIPIYLSKGTGNFLINKLKDKTNKFNNFNYIKEETNFEIEDMCITPFKVSHDAVEPVGFSITSNDSTLTIATDLGYISDNVYEHLLNSKLSVIESNYARQLLMYGPYSYPLKCRIQSDIGHLSNEDTALTVLNLARQGKRDFILGHISLNNNEPDQALFEVTNLLKNNGFNLAEFNINVATRDLSCEVYDL